jgi:hypothetical protein
MLFTNAWARLCIPGLRVARRPHHTGGMCSLAAQLVRSVLGTNSDAASCWHKRAQLQHLALQELTATDALRRLLFSEAVALATTAYMQDPTHHPTHRHVPPALPAAGGAACPRWWPGPPRAPPPGQEDTRGGNKRRQGKGEGNRPQAQGYESSKLAGFHQLQHPPIWLMCHQQHHAYGWCWVSLSTTVRGMHPVLLSETTSTTASLPCPTAGVPCRQRSCGDAGPHADVRAVAEPAATYP